MNPTDTSLTLAILAEQTPPAIVEELSDTLTYVGYCLPTTTGYDDPSWLIRRVKKTINDDGSCKWTDRADLVYKHSGEWA
ncbi:MAG: hypothetical protein ACI35Q_08415 [Marinilabiliaceae bacterium]